jgi:manganese efflux pump family protein
MLQTIVLAFSLSTDAFAASVAKGARYPDLSFQGSIAIAASFGILEASAPLLGHWLGLQFASVIADYDHWLAFTILGALGIRMIWKSFQFGQSFESSAAPTVAAVFATAIGTSIDATAIGLTLAFFGSSIPLILFIIGAVTFVMVLIGLNLGGIVGGRYGKWAEFAGGLGLIAIGANILVTHLSA